jgi:hypothetical protein
MLVACSSSGDGTTNAEPDDIVEAPGDESNIVTSPTHASTNPTTLHSGSTDARMDEALAAVSAHAAELAEQDRFSGAMLVAHNGEIHCTTCLLAVSPRVGGTR